MIRQLLSLECMCAAEISSLTDMISGRWFPGRSVYCKVKAGHCESARMIQGRFPVSPETSMKTQRQPWK